MSMFKCTVCEKFKDNPSKGDPTKCANCNLTNKVEIGKIYNVNHNRKGKFVCQVTEVNGEWITGTIIEGMAHALCDYNEKFEGEEITMRDSLCTLTLKEVA